MSKEVIMPALGMAQDTGVLLRWLQPEGAWVEKGEKLMEVETDKAIVEVEAPAAGQLQNVSAAEGQTIPVGTVIAIIFGAEENAPSQKPKTPTAALDPVTTEAEQILPAAALASAVTREPMAKVATKIIQPHSTRVPSSPKAKRLAKELGVNLAQLYTLARGTGPEGALRAADLQAGHDPPRFTEVSAELPLRAPPQQPSAEDLTASTSPAPEVPHTAGQQPHATTTNHKIEVDATVLLKFMRLATHVGYAIVMGDILTRIVASALRAHPGILPAGARPEIDLHVFEKNGQPLVVSGIDVGHLNIRTVAARRNAAKAMNTASAPAPVTVLDFSAYPFGLPELSLESGRCLGVAIGKITPRVIPIDGEMVIRPMTKLRLTTEVLRSPSPLITDFMQHVLELCEDPFGIVVYG